MKEIYFFMECLPFISYLMMNSDILIGSRYVDKFGSHKSWKHLDKYLVYIWVKNGSAIGLICNRVKKVAIGLSIWTFMQTKPKFSLQKRNTGWVCMRVRKGNLNPVCTRDQKVVNSTANMLLLLGMGFALCIRMLLMYSSPQWTGQKVILQENINLGCH